MLVFVSEGKPHQRSHHPDSVLSVFLVFLRLGLTSFGGPVAHLGYFREAFVERRRWLSEKAYADLVALCHFLPGPASSQVGMALGLQRAGLGGMLAAWLGFTAPSWILLVAFAYGVSAAGDLADAGWVLGLKAAAVAVVAHAVLSMARTLSPDPPRASIAAGVMIAVLLAPTPALQIAALAAAGIVGLLWLRPDAAPVDRDDAFTVRVSKKTAGVCLAVFAALLVGLPVLANLTGHAVAAVLDIFYRTGSLVFGGGHVVLPLLQAETVSPGLVDADVFLAGYGAAQAVPGPLFTFAGFVGASNSTEVTGVLGAALATVAIFLPAMLLTVGTLPLWEKLRSHRLARRALAGVNAGVVGMLAAALYHPVFTTGVLDSGVSALVVAVAAFVALHAWRVPAWAVVAAAAALGWVIL